MLQKWTAKKKKTKLPVSSQLIKSLYDLINASDWEKLDYHLPGLFDGTDVCDPPQFCYWSYLFLMIFETNALICS